MKRTALGATVLFLISVGARAAFACQALTCEQAQEVIMPAAGSTVPSNFATIELDTDFKTLAEVGFELRDAGGTAIAVDLQLTGNHVLARPVSPLAPGNYTVLFDVPCYYDKKLTKTSKFTVDTRSAPPPSALGTATASEHHAGWLSVPDGSGGCSRGDPASVVDIKYSFPAELTPYLPLTRFKLLVDGKEWAYPLPGHLGPIPGPITSVYDTAYHFVDTVATVCKSKFPDAVPEISSGAHTAVLQAYVAGVGALSPLMVAFKTDCTADFMEKGIDDAAASSGCTLPGRRDASQGSLLLVALAALLLARRRRCAASAAT